MKENTANTQMSLTNFCEGANETIAKLEQTMEEINKKLIEVASPVTETSPTYQDRDLTKSDTPTIFGRLSNINSKLRSCSESANQILQSLSRII